MLHTRKIQSLLQVPVYIGSEVTNDFSWAET